MSKEDINNVVPLYIEYYNNNEDAEWTTETTFKRIHYTPPRTKSSTCQK